MVKLVRITNINSIYQLIIVLSSLGLIGECLPESLDSRDLEFNPPFPLEIVKVNAGKQTPMPLVCSLRPRASTAGQSPLY
jgi:hypothetical protein